MQFSKMKRMLLLAFVGLLLFSCSKDGDEASPVIPNEEELITTVIYTLSPVSGAKSIELRFTDLDGDGGMAPTFEVDSIPSETDFTGRLQLLNQASIPEEEITEEILAESEDHQFFFNTTGGLNLAVNYSDQDGNGKPLGLTTTLSSGKTGNGFLTITLRHQPDKMADGVSEGDITNAGGETDIEVVFPVYVFPK